MYICVPRKLQAYEWNDEFQQLKISSIRVNSPFPYGSLDSGARMKPSSAFRQMFFEKICQIFPNTLSEKEKKCRKNASSFEDIVSHPPILYKNNPAILVLGMPAIIQKNIRPLFWRCWASSCLLYTSDAADE